MMGGARGAVRDAPGLAKSLLFLLALTLLAACAASPALPSPPVLVCDTPVATPKPATLSEGWRFRTDPQDVGLADGWYEAGHDDAGWQALTPGRPWEFDGIDYDGVAWYRLRTTLPDWSQVYAGFGGVDDAATLWVNGAAVGSWGAAESLPIFVELTAHADPGSEVVLAFRIKDEGIYGGLKQPVVLGPDVVSVMDGAQFTVWQAHAHPDWPLPSWSRGAPLAWTMTGALSGDDEALMSSGGAIAPWSTAPTVILWLYDPATGALHTPTQDALTFSLVAETLPIPRFTWALEGATARGVLFHDATDDAVRFHVTVTNEGAAARDLSLFVAVQPSAINTQSRLIRSAAVQDAAWLWINAAPFLAAAAPADAAGVGTRAEVMRAAISGAAPDAPTVCDPVGNGAAVLRYDLSLGAGAARDLDFAFPSRPGDPFPPAGVNVLDRLAQTQALWTQETQRASLTVPDTLVSAGVPASVGYLLLALDADGPHPGPLAHDAVWVRDAAYIGLALLQMGHADVVGAYIPEILAAQEADGRIPPIQGPLAPWDDDEWDAQGQILFLAMAYYRFTGDGEALLEWYPALRAAARFLVELRAAESAPAGPAAGLLPPSKSVEDIGPPDWRHYWDNFWAVAGLESAAYVAGVLGEGPDAVWMQDEADALRDAIVASIEAVMGPDPAYIPSAVENLEGPSMARGTVPALWPYEVFSPDDPLLQRAFDYYHQNWIAPYEGGFLHREAQFWPYGGLELAHAYLRLGRGDVLHQILG
ncbi:MAG: hypothetical protein JXB35_16215, partial [Anaerolineae bacterium]|nr:hypothetical protein [Anaerolineae bacterium]